MSGFNFGGTGGSTGPRFSFGGAPAAATTAPTAPTANTGFTFGQTTNTGGFSFGGAASATSTPAPSAGFGAQTTATAAPGGFSFGGASTAGTSTTTAPSSGFSFGGASSGTTGFGAGIKPPAQATSGATTGFAAQGGFGAKPAPAAQTTGLTLGTPGSGTATFGGFGGLGAKTTATTAPTPNTGFTLGGAAALPTTGQPGLGTNLGMVRPTVVQPTNTLGVTQPQTVPSAQSGTAGQAVIRPLAAHSGQSGVLGGTGVFNTAPPAYTAPATNLSNTQGGLTLGTAVAPTTSSMLYGLLGSAPKTSATGLTLTQGMSTSAMPALNTGAAAAAISTAPTGLGLRLQTAGVAATTSLTGFLGQTGTSTATSATGFGLGATATTTTQASLTTATTTTSSAAHTPSMNYTQLEEQINKWMLELDDQEKNFLQKATQVNAWDRLLIDNGEKITQLNTDVERVKIDQQRLDHELDFILAQQRELEEMLVPLEKSVEQLPPVNYQQHADLEREHTYQLAENVDAQLKRMVQDLKEIIEHLNTNNSASDNADPLVQIGKILNVHMDSLQWVDQNTALLQRRVEEVSKQAELRRKDQERNFRLAYN